MALKNEAPRRVLVAVSSSRSSKDALLWTLDKLIQSPDDILMLLHVLKPIEYIATRGEETSHKRPQIVTNP